MIHKLIKIDNYLLVLDDSEIKIGDHFYDNDGEMCKYDKLYVVDPNNFNDNQKIIAHLPLNGSPILDGVDLLPPYSRHQEDGVDKDLFYHKQVMNPYATESYSHTAYEKGFIEGYNKSKEKFRYTEEDMRKVWKAGQKYWETSGESLTFEELLEKLDIQQYPTEFESEIHVECTGNNDQGCFHDSAAIDCGCVKPKTITTTQGIQWVGKYK